MCVVVATRLRVCEASAYFRWVCSLGAMARESIEITEAVGKIPQVGRNTCSHATAWLADRISCIRLAARQHFAKCL